LTKGLPSEVGKARKRLVIESWRFISHSFALVAQSHCLSLLHRGDVELRFVDLPYYGDTWRRTRGILPADEEAAVEALRAPELDFAPDATYTMRPERPDFSSPRSGRRFVFGTAEYRMLKTQNRSGLTSGADVPETVSVVTPSKWPALAYERFGIARDRIHVVPLGIDPAVFRPDAAARKATREALGLQDAFIYLSVGAMTWNKGIDVLLAAFAQIAETERDAVLFLKGADAIYDSEELVRQTLGAFPERARSAIAARLVYEGGQYPSAKVADLLRAADVYVSPYRAEGFNMPVLEAAACGTPVICTAGGPTDEFTEEAFAWRIRSSPRQVSFSATDVGDYLEPDVDHLIELMRRAAQERDDAARIGAESATYAAENFSWGRVTNRLFDVLFTAPYRL
jgi:glycosyltransferase involved in cell wall biosynthesis